MERLNSRVYVTLWFAITGLFISIIWSLIVLGAFFQSVFIATFCSALWGGMLGGIFLKKVPSNKIAILAGICIGILSFLTYSIVFTLYENFFDGYTEFKWYRLGSDLLLVMGVGGLLASPAILIGGALSGYLLNKSITKRKNA